MHRKELRGRGLSQHVRDKLTKQLVDSFEEDKEADHLNMTNEKQLNRVITQIARQNKKKAKPIDTRCLIRTKCD